MRDIIMGRRRVLGALYVRNISPSIKMLFKSAVAAKGGNMTEVIEDLMRLYISKPRVLEKLRRKYNGS